MGICWQTCEGAVSFPVCSRHSIESWCSGLPSRENLPKEGSWLAASSCVCKVALGQWPGTAVVEGVTASGCLHQVALLGCPSSSAHALQPEALPSSSSFLSCPFHRWQTCMVWRLSLPTPALSLTGVNSTKSLAFLTPFQCLLLGGPGSSLLLTLLTSPASPTHTAWHEFRHTLFYVTWWKTLMLNGHRRLFRLNKKGIGGHL